MDLRCTIAETRDFVMPWHGFGIRKRLQVHSRFDEYGIERGDGLGCRGAKDRAAYYRTMCTPSSATPLLPNLQWRRQCK